MVQSAPTHNSAGTPFGRLPSLTHQIKELIHDYPEGIGIIKELVQNADDAAARSLHVLIDWRSHSATALPSPAMAELQGPALLFVNDSVFSDVDFDRIQEIYQSGKVRSAEKTGQFGKGFNTVYNVTDWPAFVTRDRVAFFDPHCSAVPGASEKNPGWYWRLEECWRSYPDLLRPFISGGLCPGQTEFPGTIFRLPFRTPEQARRSQISSKPFTEGSAWDLVRELLTVREELLIFLKNLEDLRLFEVRSPTDRRELLAIETTNPEEVREARGQVLGFLRGDALEGDALEVVSRLQGKSPVLVPYVHRYKIRWSESGSGAGPAGEEEAAWRVVACLALDSEGKLAQTVETMLDAGMKAVPLAGAAARLSPRVASKVKQRQGTGKVYCALPLPGDTVFPVHINGFFDLDSSRHALTAGPGLTGSARDRARWNELLAGHVVAPAYAAPYSRPCRRHRRQITGGLLRPLARSPARPCEAAGRRSEERLPVSGRTARGPGDGPLPLGARW